MYVSKIDTELIIAQRAALFPRGHPASQYPLGLSGGIGSPREGPSLTPPIKLS